MRMVEIRRASDKDAKFINIDFKAVIGGFVLFLISIISYFEVKERDRNEEIRKLHGEAIDLLKDESRDMKDQLRQINRTLRIITGEDEDTPSIRKRQKRDTIATSEAWEILPVTRPK